MIVHILNHKNILKKYFPNFCQITATAYLNVDITVYFMLLLCCIYINFVNGTAFQVY